MVKKIIILVSFFIAIVFASDFNECEKRVNKSSKWILLYNKNKKEVNSISKCVLGNMKTRVFELYEFDDSENYATLYIAGTIDEYEENQNQYVSNDSVYTNYSCELKKKKKISLGKNGGMDLSQIGWGWTGLDILFQGDSINAIRIHGDGEHYASKSFVERIESCSEKHNIRLEKEYVHNEKMIH